MRNSLNNILDNVSIPKMPPIEEMEKLDINRYFEKMFIKWMKKYYKEIENIDWNNKIKD